MSHPPQGTFVPSAVHLSHDIAISLIFYRHQPSLTFLNEGNLYRLIIPSRLPAAERFETEVGNEVLPAIRKTGRCETSSPSRITQAPYRKLADIVHALSFYFAYQSRARYAAWQRARSICGTHATEMPVDKYPAVLAALKSLKKRTTQFITLRQPFERRTIEWVFGDSTEILPEPVFSEINKRLYADD